MRPVNSTVKLSPTQVDNRCSAACTRAAIAIVLFTALAILVLQPLRQVRANNAFGEYVTKRLQLKYAIEALDSDFCWKKLRSSKFGEDAYKQWNLATLMGFRCGDIGDLDGKPEPVFSSWGVYFKWDMPSFEKTHKGPPPAPTNLRVVYPIDEIQYAVDILTSLGNGEFINKARSASTIYDHAIYRWQVFINRILLPKNMPVVSSSVATIAKDKKQIWHLSRKDLLEKLSLEDLTLLSNYESPELSEVVSVLKIKDSFTLPSLGMTVGLAEAPIFIELGMLISLIYFWLYQREAKLSQSYPAMSTLFSVFMGSFGARILFYIFCVAPPLSAIILGRYAWHYTYFPVIIALCSTFFSCLIIYESKKS